MPNFTMKKARMALVALAAAIGLVACHDGHREGTPTPTGPAAPSALSYPSPQTYTAGTAITALNPTVTGTVASYAVSPALPAGLSIGTSSGQISGTPSAATAQATYTVTAQNTGGSTSFGLVITVNAAPPAAPSALSYPSPQTFTVGTAITPLNPTVTGTVTSYAVSPALPNGLSLNTTTGQVSGTPQGAVVQATYTVTATNAGGNTTFGLVIAVNGPAVAGWQPLFVPVDPNSLSNSFPDVAGSADGDTVVTWSERTLNGPNQRVVRFSAAANQWLPFEIAGTTPTGGQNIGEGRVAVATLKRVAVAAKYSISGQVKEGFARYDGGADNTASPAWGAPDLLSPGSASGQGVMNSAVGFTRDGSTSVAVWSQLDTASGKQSLLSRAFRYATCRYPAGSPACTVNAADLGLRPVINVVPAPGDFRGLAVTASGSTDLLATWYAPNPADTAHDLIYVSRYDGRLGIESWSTPTVINTGDTTSAPFTSANNPVVANAAGDAAMVWPAVSYNGGGPALLLSRNPGGSGWLPPEPFDVQGSLTGGPPQSLTGPITDIAVAIDPSGTVTVAWLQLAIGVSTEPALHVRRCLPSAACGAPTIITTPNRFSSLPVMAASPNGDVTVAWVLNTGNDVVAVRYTAATDSWDTSATTLTDRGGTSGVPRVAADGLNRVTVTWSDSGQVYIKRFQ